MKFLGRIKGCTKLNIMSELNLLPITDKIKKYRTRWSNHLNEMNTKRLPKQALNCKPRGRRDMYWRRAM